MYPIRVSFERVLNSRSFLFTCLLSLFTNPMSFKICKLRAGSWPYCMLLLSPSPGNQRGCISNLLLGQIFLHKLLFHNSCCNWAYSLSWVDFSGTGRCGKGNHARWLRVLLQRYTIKMSKTYLTHLYDSKHFICQPDDSNTLFYGIYGDIWNNITYALGEHHHRS